MNGKEIDGRERQLKEERGRVWHRDCDSGTGQEDARREEEREIDSPGFHERMEIE